MRDVTLGMLFTVGLCCVYPILFHFAWMYIANGFAKRDWRNINWSSLSDLWRDNQ